MKKDKDLIKSIDPFKYDGFRMIPSYSDYGDVTSLQVLRRFIHHINKYFGELNDSMNDFIKLYTDLSDIMEEHDALLISWNEMVESNSQFKISVTEMLENWINDPRLEELINDVLFNSKLDKVEFEAFENAVNVLFNSKLDKVEFEAFENAVNKSFVVFGLKTKDYTEFQSCLNVLEQQGGGKLIILEGVYDLNNSNGDKYIEINSPNIEIIGSGLNTVLENCGFNITTHNISFNNFSIKPKRLFTCGVRSRSIDLKDNEYLKFSNMYIEHCYDGILFYKVNGNVSVENCVVDKAARIGITIDYVVGSSIVFNNIVTDSKQGYHFEGSTNVLSENNTAKKCGMSATYKVPTTEQPNSYAGAYCLSLSKNVSLINCKSINSDKSSFQLECENIEFINCSGIGGINIFGNSSKDFTIKNCDTIGVYCNSPATLDGKLIIEDCDNVSQIEVKGSLNFISIKNNKKMSRININNLEMNSYVELKNCYVESVYQCGISGGYVYVEDIVFKALGTSEQYPDYLGFRFKGTSKTLIINNFHVALGSSTGNHIVIEGSAIDNFELNNYTSEVNSGTNLGSTLNKSKMLFASGTSVWRPTGSANKIMYYDTTINKMIVKVGENWRDFNGNIV